MSLPIIAQDIEVKKFGPLEKDQTTVSMRNDNNGNPCALLIVQSLKEGFEFEGWVVGDVERKDDTYWVYIANGAKHVKIKHSDFQTKDVVFGDYEVIALKGGTTYILQLVDDTKDIINKVYRLGWNLNNIDIPNSARSFLNMSATRGDTKAQIAMAQLSLTGKVSVGEFLKNNKGLYWINKLLSKGDSTCLDSMPGELMYAYACQLIWNGISYDRSPNHVDTDKERKVYTLASEFEIKAILKGFKDAGNELFKDYPQSDGLPKYAKDIIRCCEDSAKNKNEKAMECLGLIYENGIGINVDLKLAADWFYCLYETNHSRTDMYRVFGNPQFPIDENILTILQNQANKGDLEAIYQLGLMYEEGRNKPLNQEKAINLYCQAKNPHAGILYRKAIIYCKRKEFEKAMNEAEKLMLDFYEPGTNLNNLEFLRSIFACYNVRSRYSFFRMNQEDGLRELSNFVKQGHHEAKEFLEQINK